MSVFKNFMNLIFTLGFFSSLSLLSYQFCSWYGCNGWFAIMRADLICNACTDASYHLKNYQVSLFGSLFTLITYQMTTLINKASAPSENYIFEDYNLGKNSPRTLKSKPK